MWLFPSRLTASALLHATAHRCCCCYCSCSCGLSTHIFYFFSSPLSHLQQQCDVLFHTETTATNTPKANLSCWRSVFLLFLFRRLFFVRFFSANLIFYLISNSPSERKKKTAETTIRRRCAVKRVHQH